MNANARMQRVHFARQTSRACEFWSRKLQQNQMKHFLYFFQRTGFVDKNRPVEEETLSCGREIER